MPSATLAESRLSTPPSSVKDKAAGRISSRRDDVIGGNCGASKPCGISPKWLPMVSMGKCSNTAASDANTTAISIPGQPGRQLRRAKISAAEPAPTANAAGLRVGNAWLSYRKLWKQRTRLDASQRQTAKILQLAGDDGDGDTAGEAHRHRVRDVANERSQSQQADQRQKQPRQQHRE